LSLRLLFTMKASVIINTYNRPLYLSRVIRGYLSQSVPPHEIIIADDGSTVETAALVNYFQEKAPVRIMHVWHEDKGFRLAKIRNRAIAAATGDYIIISDDDTIPSPYMVQDHEAHAEQGCFIQGHRVLLKEEVSKDFTFERIVFSNLLKLAVTGKIGNFKNALRPPFPVIVKSRKRSGIRGCNMSFFRKDLLAVNGFNEDFEGWGSEDFELVERLYKYGLFQKNLQFRAVCFHLYHPEYSRDNRQKNIELFKETIAANGFYLKNGLDKYIEENRAGQKGLTLV